MEFERDIELINISERERINKYINFNGLKCFISPMPIKLSVLLKNKIELIYREEKKLRKDILLLQSKKNKEKELKEKLEEFSQIQSKNIIEIAYTFLCYFQSKTYNKKFEKEQFLEKVSINEINKINKEIFEELESDYNIVNSILLSSSFFDAGEKVKKN